MTSFERDFETYERELPGLLQRFGEGMFALIHRNEVEEVFANQNEAMDAGYSRHQAGSFTVKKILLCDLEDPEQFSAACRD
jgi:hypothetical protein